MSPTTRIVRPHARSHGLTTLASMQVLNNLLLMGVGAVASIALVIAYSVSRCGESARWTGTAVTFSPIGSPVVPSQRGAECELAA
jgi:hypothetical protein